MVGLKKNLYDAFNPQNAAEHMAVNGDEEDFFKAEDGAAKEEKDRIIILNFIVKQLHVGMDRFIPADAREESSYEIYHQAEFEGVKINVCAYFDFDGEERRCLGVVKIAPRPDEPIDSGTWVEFGVPNGKGIDMANDSFVPSKHYWVPRWQYLVRYIRERALNDFESNGVEIVRKEPEKPAAKLEGKSRANGRSGGADSFGEVTEELEVFAGAKGKIIGPGGSMIKEIKETTGVYDIDMGPKNVEPRPAARDPATITLKGKTDAIKQAKAMIEQIVSDWVDRKPARRNDDAGGNDFGDNGGSSGFDTYDSQPTKASGNWGSADTFEASPIGEWGDQPEETTTAAAGGW